ncbi:MAG: outer membrane beta-barrel protein [Candidatus Cloacimonetes bacterium]|nr:outer membrane beta-barrel protein [Candidatus Cloacimonadota bacterium]
MRLVSKKLDCFVICLVLFIFAAVPLFAQDDSKAATQHTWHVSGMFSSFYHFADDDDDDGSLMLNFNPGALWFVIDGLGIGADADLYHFNSYFNHTNLSIGPRVAWYFRQHELLDRLIPYAGCSFHYVNNDADFGSTETGWRTKLGIGISPLLGDIITVPVEFGFMIDKLTQDFDKEDSYTATNKRIYLVVGFGAFL